jgi:casein kinase 1
VIERLGLSLEDLLSLRRSPFSLKTILMIVDRSLCRVEFVHRKRILHRDIEPGNILVGVDQRCLYLIDSAAAEPRSDRDAALRQPACDARRRAVAPRRPHLARVRLGLSLQGRAPVADRRAEQKWQGNRADPRDERRDEPGDLCAGMPDEFRRYFELVMALEIQDEPPNATLRELFRELFVQHAYCYDCRFDWTKPPTCHAPSMWRISPQKVLEGPRRGVHEYRCNHRSEWAQCHPVWKSSTFSWKENHPGKCAQLGLWNRGQ